MRRRSRWLIAALFSIGVFTLAALALLFDIVTSIPSFDGLKSSLSVPIRLANGKKSTRLIGPKTPQWVGLSSVSVYLPRAVIASEDAAFYSHNGIDIHEIKAAIKKDMENRSFSHGASTLTQQVLKNTYLGTQKTILRKVKEIYWARHLENALTKKEILAFYINMAEWGPGIYGIGEAARHYFNCAPIDLSAKQSAFLAMILPSPRRYHAYFYQKPLTAWASQRVSRILNIMRSMGVLAQDQYELALNEQLWGIPILSADAVDAPQDPGDVIESDEDVFEEPPVSPSTDDLELTESHAETEEPSSPENLSIDNSEGRDRGLEQDPE